ncbi:MAG TPA: hypothetical protein VJ418_07715, partial [Streptosporangiaceae bacterium]|nr:hypothetical protein [Streptosporangiaceae bacterium]
WEARGRSGLAAAALLLAALWPVAGSAAGQGSSTVYRVRLLRRLLHGHAGAGKAAVAAAIVVVGVAVAAGVILARPAGRATPAPMPASARAAAAAPAPAQLTGTQLAAALLPVSDFPAGYKAAPASPNSGSSLLPFPFQYGAAAPTKASCRLGLASAFFGPQGAFELGWGTAEATNSFERFTTTSGGMTLNFFLNEAVYQFSSPAKAEVFLSSYVRTCLIDNRPWSDGVDTAPVDGDQAVTADLRSNDGTPGDNWAADPLYVLHGTDVFALSAAEFPVGQGSAVIPGAAELIAKLIARVGALSPASSAVPVYSAVPAPSAGSSLAPSVVPSPGLAPSRRQAAQALAVLLAQSGTDRTAITQAVSAVEDCSPGLSQDETTFSDAASSRQALLGKLAALPDRSALPASMLQDLTTAWQASGKADQDFANWTQDEISHGCSTNYQSDASYRAATGPDDRATQDKKAFAALWTAIANEYGLPSYHYNQI